VKGSGLRAAVLIWFSRLVLMHSNSTVALFSFPLGTGVQMIDNLIIEGILFPPQQINKQTSKQTNKQTAVRMLRRTAVFFPCP
jgi:hypothetical protein